MVVAIEDAGFEIRDQLCWVYSTGLAKGCNISKAIDKAAGAVRTEGTREWSGGLRTGNMMGGATPQTGTGTSTRTLFDEPVTPEAKQWDGWNTSLAPSLEPICMARKPFNRSTYQNILRYGTGGLNIDACRTGDSGGVAKTNIDKSGAAFGGQAFGCNGDLVDLGKGRWPANLLLEEGEVEAMMNAQSGGMACCFPTFGYTEADLVSVKYQAKPDGQERDAGLELITEKIAAGGMEGRHDGSFDGHITMRRNPHPTIKPITLMRWLCRLVTPEHTPEGKIGTVLDCFCGSGSTGCAALIEGFNFIGIDLSEHYLQIADARIRHWSGQSLASVTAGQPSLFE